MGKLTLDPKRPPQLSPEDRARLEALTDPQITAAAEADPDNRPLSAAELAQLDMRALVRRARATVGLSQAQFARTFHISLGRLRDLEQGRYKGHDSALSAYLSVIAREPEAVRRALGES
jgi:putative transcriptional regulator